MKTLKVMFMQELILLYLVVLLKRIRTKVLSTWAILILTSISSLLFAQQANVWYFHQKLGLNFNTTPPTVLTNGAIVTPVVTPGMEGEGVASIADNNGNLLFYTDGINVFNRNHVIMPNGNGLMGHASSAQSAIVVPRPGSATNYYLITAPLTNTTNGIRYNEIDMGLNAGLGDVIGGQKNILLSPAIRMMEGIAAVPHNNGTDYWLITHQGAGTNAFNIYLINAGGISFSNTYNVGYTVPAGGSDIGLIKTNSCYNRIAIAYHSSDIVDVLNFNNATGVVSAPLSITNFAGGDGVYGLEFSPNGQFLYVTGLYNRILYQFNISSGVAGTINASRFTVGSAVAGADRLAALQLGPNGIIYAANHSWGPYNNNPGTFTYLGAINNPNNAGAACNWVNNAIAFPSVEGPSGVFTGIKHGLPTFLKSLVGASLDIQVSSACLGQATSFSYTFSGVVSGSVTWNFGDGSPTSNLNSPTHTYASTGNYTVTLTLTDMCGNVHSINRTINILNAQPSVNWSCSGSNITLTGTNPGTGNSGYLWYGGTGYSQLLSSTGTANYTGSPASFMVYGTTGVSEASYESVGNGWPQAGSDYVDFNANSNFLLQSIKVRTANGEGGCNVSPTTATFTLRQGATVIATRNVSVNCGGGSQTLTLNISVPSGTGYRLESNIRYFFVSAGDAAALPWRTNPAVSYVGTGIGVGGPFADWDIIVPSTCSALQVNVDCALPVELVLFKGTKQYQWTLLNWNTALEKNNKGFSIERSSNGIHFETIGYRPGVGNSTTLNQYSFYDYQPLPGLNYYRLLQTDEDGQSSYSQTISVLFDQSNDVVIYPNPSHGMFEFHSKHDEKIAYEIHNALGQFIFGGEKEDNTFSIDLSGLSNGIYYLSVQHTAQIQTYKLIKH